VTEIVIGAIILWIVPIFVTQSQGKAKDREGWLYGVFLGWLGVLTLAVLPPRSDRRARTAQPSAAGGTSLEERLRRLDALHDTGSISDTEHAERRAAMLAEL